jgi:uncharacterized membrane protein
MMGPTISAGAGLGLIMFILGMLILSLAIGTVAVFMTGPRGYPRRVALSPTEVLRDRYARGELSQNQYREALLDLLKDRYARGEIDLEDYEARSQELLVDGRPKKRGIDHHNAATER